MTNFRRFLNDRNSRRPAITLLEITISTALLGMLMTASVQVLRAAQTQQRSADRRAAALQSVQAIAEKVSNLPWQDLSDERLQKLELPNQTAEYLPGANFRVYLAEEADPLPAKRITLALNWHGPYGQPAAPVRLTIWVFQDESD